VSIQNELKINSTNAKIKFLQFSFTNFIVAILLIISHRLLNRILNQFYLYIFLHCSHKTLLYKTGTSKR